MNSKIKFSTLTLMLGLGLAFGQEIKYGEHSLEAHGYMRTGMGRSLDGGEMVHFKAPETMAKTRFGNEADHYAELRFDYNYKPEDRDDSYKVAYMMKFGLPYSSENLTGTLTPEISQLFFKWNNFYKGADIWFGKRYYQRESIHLLDWFWLNAVQGADIGAGVENIKFGGDNSSHLDLALIRFSDKLEDPNNQDKDIQDYKLDARLKEISLSDNLDLNFVGQIGRRVSTDNSNNIGGQNKDYDNKTGYTLGAWTEYSKDNFYNRTSAIYRTSINLVDNPYSGKGLLEINNNGDQLYDLDKASDLEITSDIQYDDKSSNGFLGVITYQHEDFGIQTTDGKDKIFSHVNTTGRYSRYLSNHLALTFDVGYDYVMRSYSDNGSLLKLTFSPEFRWDKGMFSRPSVRPFITYAKWSDELKGEVGVFNGNEAYSDKTHGIILGLQLEMWW